MPARRRRLEAAHLHVPLAMIDVFALSLMAIILSRPQFIDSARLPALRSSERAPAVPQGPPPIDVVVAPDGAVRVADGPCDVDDVPRRLSEAGDPTRPIRLLIQLDDERRGGVETVIRLQLALSRANLMSRVVLATDPGTSHAPDDARG